MSISSDEMPERGRAQAVRGRTGAARLPFEARRAQILEVAAAFFAEQGLNAQTRQLAERCGISQRLLYRFFPTKEELIREVYSKEMLGGFKAVWFVTLQDRSRPIAERLEQFYGEYVASTLTRDWLRLFLYASLNDAQKTPDFIAAIIIQLVETIMRETAAEKGLALPESPDLVRQMGWTLHGGISDFAARRHIFGGSRSLPEATVIALHVRLFLAGFEEMLASARDI